MQGHQKAKDLIASGQPLAFQLGLDGWAIATRTGQVVRVDPTALTCADPLVKAWLADKRRAKAVFSSASTAEALWKIGRLYLRGALGFVETMHLLTAGLPPAEVSKTCEREMGLPCIGSTIDLSPKESLPKLYEAMQQAFFWARMTNLKSEAVADSDSASILGRMTGGGVPASHAKWEEIGEGALLQAARARGEVAKVLGLPLTHRSLHTPQALLQDLKTGMPEECVKPLAVWQRAEILASHLRDPRNGALWPNWQATAATTGRITATSPAVVSLPGEYHEAIVAPPGMLLASFDWSSEELWVAAVLAKDEHLRQALNAGSVYEDLAAELGVDRANAKRTLLGALYGAQPGPEVLKVAGATIRHCRGYRLSAPKDGGSPILRSWTGALALEGRTRRRLVLAGSLERDNGGKLRRSLQNFPIQGTAASLLRRAMVQVEQAISPRGRITMVLHDEIVTALPKAEATRRLGSVAREMNLAAEHILGCRIPLKVGVGQSLAEARAGAISVAQD